MDERLRRGLELGGVGFISPARYVRIALCFLVFVIRLRRKLSQYEFGRRYSSQPLRRRVSASGAEGGGYFEAVVYYSRNDFCAASSRAAGVGDSSEVYAVAAG